MSAVQLNVAPELSAHVAMALEFHLRRCREQSIPVPPALADLKDWAQVVARGLSAPALAPSLDTDPVVPLLLSIPAAADLLGCSSTKVKKLIASGELPTVQLGGVRRLRRADLEHFVEGLGSGSFRDRLEQKEPAS